jgi:hypothetical protein
MKRCLKHLAPSLPAVLAALLISVGLPAAAQPADSSDHVSVRQFPKSALRGLLKVQVPPEISLNGKPDRLAPGARIRNVGNTFMTPSALAGQELLVNYTRDNIGQVHEVWVLSAEEAREKREGLSARNFSFGFESSRPAQDDGRTPYHQLPR